MTPQCIHEKAEFLRLSQCFPEILQQILLILDSDAYPYQVLRNTRTLLFRLVGMEVNRGCGVDDQCSGIADIGRIEGEEETEVVK